MRWLRLFALLFLPLFALFLPSCGNNTTGFNPGRHPAGTGPFDRNGNYVEAWADTPSKWSKRSGSAMASNSAPTPAVEPAAEADTPSVASTEEPPADAVPLPPSGASSVQTVKTTTPVRKSSEVEVASLSRSKSTARRDDDKPKSTVKKSTTTVATKAKSKETLAKNSKSKLTPKELAAAKAKAKSKANASVSTKSKATAKKETVSVSKKKPATRYTVKKGDNLVKIADRYNTTAAAIKKANGLKSTVIAPGKTLVIPKG